MKLSAYIFVFGYVLLLLVAFVLPYFSTSEMSIVGHSISELGAQQVRGNWLANSTIIILSVVVLLYGSFALKQQWLQLLLLSFFTISFALTGMYHQAGHDVSIHYNYTHDALHYLFSNVAGFAFVLFCISVYFKVTNTKHRLQTLFIMGLSILLTILQFKFPSYQGMVQRILYLMSFAWLFYVFTIYSFDRRTIPFSNSKWLF